MNKNIFEGKSTRSIFCNIIYRFFLKKIWFNYEDVLTEYWKKKLDTSVSKEKGYSELKKAFMDVKGKIKEKLGDTSIEERGNNRNKEFRYIGEENDPLADLKNTQVVKDIKRYWEFCQDSSGILPPTWVEYFFKNTTDLYEIKNRKKEQIIGTDNKMLKNIELLPKLYEKIKKKKIIEVEYKSSKLIFHPHYIREYNRRWFLFGHAEGKSPEFGYNIPLDRISSFEDSEGKNKFKEAPANFYSNYFKDIVGVTHNNDREDIVNLLLRVNNEYIYNLIKTKPIHNSQSIIKKYGEYSGEEYGEFELRVRINRELIAQILQMGESIEVVAPSDIRQEVKKIITQMMELYKK